MMQQPFSPATFFSAHPPEMHPAEVAELHLDWPSTRDFSEERFSSLEGLEPFVSLEKLHLTQHQLSSLESLPKFPHLRELVVAQNQLQSLAGIERCPQLAELDVSVNELTDLRPLAACRSLGVLHAGHNLLASLEGIESLPSLRWLGIQGNAQLRWMEVVNALPALQTLYAGAIKWQGPLLLRECQQLTQLQISLEANPSSKGWGWPPQLRHLSLGLKSEVVDFQGHDSLESLLIRAALSGLRISVAEFGALTSLHLQGCKFARLSWRDVPSLQTLHFEHCQLPSELDWNHLPSLSKVILDFTVMPASMMKQLQSIHPNVVIELR
jgi:Leucine-rich repeat (LRR) protein